MKLFSIYYVPVNKILAHVYLSIQDLKMTQEISQPGIKTLSLPF